MELIYTRCYFMIIKLCLMKLKKLDYKNYKLDVYLQLNRKM